MTNDEANYLACAIPVRQESVLLIQRSRIATFLPGAWGLPAGMVEPYERPRDAALRELYEETGLRGRVRRKVGESTFEGDRLRNGLKNIQINFLVDIDLGADVQTGSEVETYRWCPVNQLDNCGLDEFIVGILEQAFVRTASGWKIYAE